jgi:hypothetical protein
MVGRDREKGDVDPLAFPADLDRERELMDRIRGLLARLVRDRAVAIAIDVAARVAPAHHFVAAFPEHALGRAAEQLLALLVPEDDPVGGVHRKDGLAAARDLLERIEVRHGPVPSQFYLAGRRLRAARTTRTGERDR